jgi:hypothetical protein
MSDARNDNENETEAGNMKIELTEYSDTMENADLGSMTESEAMQAYCDELAKNIQSCYPEAEIDVNWELGAGNSLARVWDCDNETEHRATDEIDYIRQSTWDVGMFW